MECSNSRARLLWGCMDMWKKIALVFTAVMICASLSACGSKADGGSSGKAGQAPSVTMAPETDPAFAKAAELYQINKCISCHGVNLEGRIGPQTNLQKIGASRTKEQMSEQIRNGGGGMPAYKSKLTEEEITSITDWLSSKK